MCGTRISSPKLKPLKMCGFTSTHAARGRKSVFRLNPGALVYRSQHWELRTLSDQSERDRMQALIPEAVLGITEYGPSGSRVETHSSAGFLNLALPTGPQQLCAGATR
jgi:hypothetical protein